MQVLTVDQMTLDGEIKRIPYRHKFEEGEYERLRSIAAFRIPHSCERLIFEDDDECSCSHWACEGMEDIGECGEVVARTFDYHDPKHDDD